MDLTFAEKHKEEVDVPKDTVNQEKLVVPRKSKGYALAFERNLIKEKIQQLNWEKKELELSKLKKKKEIAQKKLNQLKAKQQAKIDKKVKAMNKEWELFEKSLDMTHWEKAQSMWSKLDEEGHGQAMLKA